MQTNWRLTMANVCNILSLLLLLVGSTLEQDFGELVGMHVGCFLDKPQERDLELRVQGIFNSVQLCTKECRNNYYKYAGLQDGRVCYCGSQYGRHGPGTCNVRCEGDGNQVCGGSDSNTIYKTGITVAGPPKNLRSKENSNSSLSVEWDPPRSPNGIVLEYIVTAALNFSYSPDQGRFTEKVLKLSNTTTTAVILGLLSGSQYVVSVSTRSLEGNGPAVSDIFWTEVGTPKVPQAPTLIRHPKDGTIPVKLDPVGEYHGPITAYQVIVLNETFPTSMNAESLHNYHEAVAEGLSYWIAAELDSGYLESHEEFVVGDNKMYGGYLNYGPLTDHDYHVGLGAVSQLNGVTRASYAKVSHEQHDDTNIIVFNFNKDHAAHDHGDRHDHDDGSEERDNLVKNMDQFMDHPDHLHEDHNDEFHESKSKDATDSAEEDSKMVTILAATIVVASVILIAAVGFFIFVRYSLGKRFRRLRADTQELTSTSQAPTIDPSENGYLDNEAYAAEPNTTRSAEEYFQSLDRKVWQIPRNFVDVQNEVLGRGRYGTVMKGSVNLNQELVSCNIYIIPNKMMEPAQKQKMIRDLDLNIKPRFHENIVNLVGICEEQDTTLLVFDLLERELKQFLLDGRSLDTHPSYAVKSDRFSSLREEEVLGMMVGIAQGLDHLVNSGVQVRDLCARSVYVTASYKPKIFGFGLADYGRTTGLDFTRWNAPETLLKNQYSGKSLVWSYGCVLWELATLGGSPYPRLKTREVKSRILQGMRLPQTMYISDPLYQLMLTCWMTDPSERPDFADILATFTDLFALQQMLLIFSLHPGFVYEEFNPSIEQVTPS